jgi:hypothetical protein
MATMPALNETQDAMQFQFSAGLPLGAAQEQLQSFCRQTKAQIVRQAEASCTMHYDVPTNFWQKWWGSQPKLELLVEMARVNPMCATPIKIKVSLCALNCSKQKALGLFEKIGSEILESLQEYLLVDPNKRAKDRLFWPHAVKVIPLNRAGEEEEPIQCRGKDLSPTGMGFYMPHDLMTAMVLIELPNPSNSTPVKIPAGIVRAKRCADGWYDVGALFRLPASIHSAAEVHV